MSSVEWTREVANDIWLKLKGIPLPAAYTDQDCTDILAKYWHRALESE